MKTISTIPHWIRATVELFIVISFAEIQMPHCKMNFLALLPFLTAEKIDVD